VTRAIHAADLDSASDQLREIDRQLDRDEARELGWPVRPNPFIPDARTNTLERFRLLASLFDLAHDFKGNLELYERETHGAEEALRDWAGKVGLDVVLVSSPPDAVPAYSLVRCETSSRHLITVWRAK
jgi:hypothetical protein